MGRFEEARTALDRALASDPINPEALHNLGVIYERLGDQPAAISQYREALRYAPQYRPSREALLRLTGSAQVGGPTTPAEQHAFELAQEASLAARRADYALAHRLLDQAERSAPRYSLVHRYRANVAYLEGDHPRAIAALERAVTLEPDNLLYQRNLEKLRQEAPGSGS
jgi:Tfp pilus assembly protein PilF